MNQPKLVRMEHLMQSFRSFHDDRGDLSVIESADFQIPFQIKRVFWISGVPEKAVRGEHANRSCTELIVAIQGKLTLWLTDGVHEQTFILDSPQKGIYIPPMFWCRLSEFSSDSICLCMADTDYQVDEYINSYTDFLNEITHASHSI